jgi:hypothetical protein
MLLALALSACAGCRRIAPALKLHYLSGFVPGTRDILAPITVAIAPPGGSAMQGRYRLGTVSGRDGEVQSELFAEDLARPFAQWLATALEDAGAKTIALEQMPPDRKPPQRAQYLLSATLQDLQIDKRFGPEKTVHGRYFTMHARATIEVELFDHAGRTILSGKVTGTEDEPPAPVGGEVFLPLETDPAESLSVAISRAIGALVLQLRSKLPERK